MPSKALSMGKLLGNDGNIPTAKLPTNIQAFDVTEIPTAKLPSNIRSLDDAGMASISTNLTGSGKISIKSLSSNTLTQSFDSNQVVDFILADSINTNSPLVSVFKEVQQAGVTSKGTWDVNSNGTNYEFLDEKPISYSSSTLTPSATGDGTFTNSNQTETFYDFSSPTAGATSTFTAPSCQGFAFNTSGTKLISLDAGYLSLRSYNLSTAWDITTISSTHNAASGISTGDFANANTTISADGAKFIGFNSSINYAYEYTMTTPFDVTTLTANGSTNSLGGASLNGAYNWFIKPGTYNTVYAVISRHLYKYTFTGGSIITGTVTRDSNFLDLDPANQKSYTNSGQLQFKPDGTEFYIGQVTDSIIEKWVLSTAWDITTASKSSDTVPYTTFGNIWVKPDGRKIYYVDNGNSKKIDEYNISNILAFAAGDVGKKVTGNSGSAVITATSGTYKSQTAFADTSAISSWTLTSAKGEADGTGIKLSGTSQVGTPIPHGTYNSVSTGITWGGYYSLYSNGGAQFGSGHFGPDGTKFYSWTSSTNVRIWTPTTAFDLSTLGNSVTNVSGFTANGGQCIRFSKTGDKAFHLGSNGYSLHSYDLSTPYDLSTKGSVTTKTMSFQGTGSVDTMGWYQDNVTVGSGGQYMGNFVISPDGSYFVGECRTGSGALVRGVMSTPYDISTLALNQSLARGVSIPAPGTQPARNRSGSAPAWNQGGGIWFADDGKLALWWGSAAVVEGFQYRFSTGWDFSTASGVYDGTTNNMGWSPPAPSGNSNRDVGTKALEIGVKPNGQVIMQATLFWNNAAAGTEQEMPVWYNLSFNPNSSNMHPYNVYSPAVTGSTGQINTSGWVDINSMTADETKNDGNVFYAVSTDNKTSWGVNKGTAGIRKIAKNNSGTWQYNNNAGGTIGYNIATSAFLGSNFDYFTASSGDFTAWSAYGFDFKPDGTRAYVMNGNGAPNMFQYDFSTAWDLSTGGYTSGDELDLTQSSSGLASGYVQGLRFKPDGTKMFVFGSYEIVEWALSTPWDIKSASFTANKSTSALGSPFDGQGTLSGDFTPDGTKVFILGGTKLLVAGLSTAWDITTLNRIAPNHAGGSVQWYEIELESNVAGGDLKLHPDGTKAYVLDNDSPHGTLKEYTLPTTFGGDLSRAGQSVPVRYTGSSMSFPQIANAYGFTFKPDGTRLYMVGWHTGNPAAMKNINEYSIGTVPAYGTSETWVNATTNNELSALQQSLTAQVYNRMDKAQIDAIPDANHYPAGSTLDLMIAPFAASGSSPVSDGVNINYVAEALIREAQPGVDYIAEFPTANKIKIKSLVDTNLKIRAQ